MISVTILTKNSERHIHEVLASLRHFDEVVVYDTGSTDATLAIASHFPNVTLYQGKFIGFGPTHNKASALSKHDWILSIDSDEVPSEEMLDEIASLSLDPRTVYSFPRRNFFNGKWIRWCGWHPDRCIRLYHRAHTRFSDDQVHEGVIATNIRLVHLKGSLKHYSYNSISDFLEKMQLYSDLFAKQNTGKKRSSVGKAIAHGCFGFFKSYILKRGFLGGSEGWIISLYNGHTAYYKYLKLREANQRQAKQRAHAPEFFDDPRKERPVSDPPGKSIHNPEQALTPPVETHAAEASRGIS